MARSSVTITLPDGSAKELPDGRRPAASRRVASASGLAKAARRARRSTASCVDLGRPIDHDATVAIVTGRLRRGPRDAAPLRPSHLMAQAVFDLFPGAKYAIGPAIADGFYYDFELPTAQHFTDDDLERIEARMREIVKEDQPFVRAEYDADGGPGALRRPAVQGRDHPQRHERARPRRATPARSAATARSASTERPGRRLRRPTSTCAAVRTCRPPASSARSS